MGDDASAPRSVPRSWLHGTCVPGLGADFLWRGTAGWKGWTAGQQADPVGMTEAMVDPGLGFAARQTCR